MLILRLLYGSKRHKAGHAHDGEDVERNRRNYGKPPKVSKESKERRRSREMISQNNRRVNRGDRKMSEKVFEGLSGFTFYCRIKVVK